MNSDNSSGNSPEFQPPQMDGPGNPMAQPEVARSAEAELPPDLRISWSWGHFAVFVFIFFVSLFIGPMVLAPIFLPHQALSVQESEAYLLGKPQFIFGSTLLGYGVILSFLYITLSAARAVPFWSSLGWRKLNPTPRVTLRNPSSYFLSGMGLAILVVVAGSQVHVNQDMPIQELLRSRTSAFLLMGMAVLLAPLVEETIFRGYLYPLFAKSFGIVPGILLTGGLFGLLHGSQLGWTWGIVVLLVIVGVILTSVRAYTGTVVASYLVHLGYNSFIAMSSIIATHGFTKMPSL